MILSIDVGGTQVKSSVMSDGIIQKKLILDTELYTQQDIKNLLERLMDHFNETIDGIAISFPGHIDDSGTLVKAGALKSFDGFPLKAFLMETFNIPVAVENDAKCAALAEVRSGNGVGCKHALVVTIGTGIGGGLIINDAIYKGYMNRAGEIGMMNVELSTRPYDTFHQIGSTTALIQAYNKALGKSVDNAKVIFDDYDRDESTKQVVDTWIKGIAVFIFNLVTSFAPEIVLLGGGVSANPKFLSMVQEAIKENANWKDYLTPIDVCKYRNDAGMVGAYYVLMEDFKNA